MIHYLLIEWAGARWIWMSVGQPPSGSDASFGGLFAFPGWALEATLEPTGDGVAVDLAWAGVARLVAMGHRLTTARGELGWLEEGGAWEDRRPLLLGGIQAEYGGDGEPVAVRLDPRPWEDSGELLSPSELVDDNTWPAAGATSEGRGYPLVIGRPGEYQRIDGSTAYCSATPCLPVGSDKVIVANTRVTTSTLTIYSEEDADSEAFAVTLQLDSEGHEVAVCDLSAAATITYDDSYHYWARWPDGGLALATGETLEAAGDIVAWALRQSSLDVDAAALEAIRAPLAGFLLGGFLDQSVSPWEWLTQEILPLLPLRLLQGPRGIRPVLWRSPSAALAIDSLDVDRAEVARDGRISTVGSGVNDITIRYAWRARTGDYLRSRRLSGSGGHISTAAAVASYRANGRLSAPVIKTEWVYRQETADRILLSQMEMLQPRRQIAIVGPLSRLAHLRPLDVVTLSDSSILLSSVPALVSRVEWGAGEIRLILELST